MYYRYRQCFDLEGESGIVVRGLGTAVVVVHAPYITTPAVAPPHFHHHHHSPPSSLHHHHLHQQQQSVYRYFHYNFMFIYLLHQSMPFNPPRKCIFTILGTIGNFIFFRDRNIFICRFILVYVVILIDALIIIDCHKTSLMLTCLVRYGLDALKYHIFFKYLMLYFEIHFCIESYYKSLASRKLYCISS